METTQQKCHKNGVSGCIYDDSYEITTRAASLRA
jgi:hypothetical protein